ncbi:PH domain-containing protein [Myroides guanonis]|uniref:PH domain-containing protein n=1 Tax=Myroides guanonis TaxID=1150112 RepID=A0A1I3PHG4_9FLAO|nr:PH domain-containing protein [Myroides guanonis]SFJ20923.1 PH domain-containing protein [Myroides guanonis]
MKKFKANKKGFVVYIIIAALLPLIILFIDKEAILDNYFILIPALLPVLLLIWIYLDTRYYIKNNQLYYKSAFLKGKIDIHKIEEIIIGKTLWVGTKPALTGKGLIIKYNKYDELYIAPKSNTELVNELVSINPNIRLVE